MRDGLHVTAARARDTAADDVAGQRRVASLPSRRARARAETRTHVGRSAPRLARRERPALRHVVIAPFLVYVYERETERL